MRNSPILLLEEIAVGGVVQIDGEIIVESEDESAEAVALSSSGCGAIWREAVGVLPILQTSTSDMCW